MTKLRNMNDSSSPEYYRIAYYWQDSNETNHLCHITMTVLYNYRIIMTIIIHMKYIMQRSIAYHTTTYYSLHV
ncbi:hypothetical protein EUGRSUZ_B01302 [Eucalyptus grandis]|uniref:Uncharacterized protein n=2 Tax=Eucalyptus grandis TaxID=71139 RepID=A0ACC3LQA3_EUCGR|nr:hypothetical protein EUGRSUZ_B01302 [Eucalyptus grandis]